MVEIVWTLEALDDLESLGEYYERTSRAYAAALIERLYTSVEILEEHHRIRRKVPEIDHDLVRELIVGQHRGVYQLMRDRIEIVAVLHSRQDIVKKFRGRGKA